MRPDAWGLAAIYALGRLLLTHPGKRIAALAIGLAAIAPLGWTAMDWALTGDPIDTLHQQERGTEAGDALTILYPVAAREVWRRTQPARVAARRRAGRADPRRDEFLIGLPLFFLGR